MSDYNKKVLVFGTFDLFHPGHLNFLKQAKKLGSELVVVVARDETVKRVKKRETVEKEDERLSNIGSVPYVDKARLGNTGTDPYKIVEEIKPDIIALGYDQTHFIDKLTSELEKMGLNDVKIVRMDAYQEQSYKSTKLRKELYKEGKISKDKL